MFGPGWEQGCPSCSFVSDHIDGANWHLPQRDVTLLAVSRAPLPRSKPSSSAWAGASSGCRPTTTSITTSTCRSPRTRWRGEVYYNYTMTEFPSEEAPGLSAFYKDPSGAVFHTYSAYARGLDMLVGAYNYLDLAPKGRDDAAPVDHGMGAAP